jgi:hypothetical protein
MPLIEAPHETMPNFIKRKHPRKEKEKETKDKDQSPSKHTNNPKEAGHKEAMEPLNTKTSMSRLKYQLNEGEVNSIKLQA